MFLEEACCGMHQDRGSAGGEKWLDSAWAMKTEPREPIYLGTQEVCPGLCQ